MIFEQSQVNREPDEVIEGKIEISFKQTLKPVLDCFIPNHRVPLIKKERRSGLILPRFALYLGVSPISLENPQTYVLPPL